MSRISTFPHRPPSEQLCDLHVYKVPVDLWRSSLNNILNQAVTETVSLGIIRVPPDLHLIDIRAEIEKQLEELAPKDYVFLRSVGRSITRVKPRQEYEWTAKYFLPPKHYSPELYILEATPELRDALAVSDRSSQLSPVSSPAGARSLYRGDGYHRYPYRQHGYPDRGGGGSPGGRSPSPQRRRRNAGGKTYRGGEREAAYTNNTNEDSGVAGMSPDNQYPRANHKDRENYYRAADSKARYNRDDDTDNDDEDKKRRQQELEERARLQRWGAEEEERRRREEEEEEEKRRREKEEKERRRRRQQEEEEDERRRREEDQRRRREDEQERRRRGDEEDEEERERRRRADEEEEERRRREEEEERRRREEEEEERRRKEEENRLKGSSDEDLDRFTSPPPLRSSSAELDGQRDSEEDRQRRMEEQKRLLEELQEARRNRQSTEKDREDLVKKAKTLQSKTQNRRNLARDVWKKRYFEEKKKTPPLEDQTSRLKDELDALHRKMMAVLEGPKERNLKVGENRPSQKSNYKIQCTRLQHDIDDLKRRVENAKMKLTGEMKLRSQADAEVRLLREELTREKIKVSQTRSQHFAELTPGILAKAATITTTPVIPSIPSSSGGGGEVVGS